MITSNIFRAHSEGEAETFSPPPGFTIYGNYCWSLLPQRLQMLPFKPLRKTSAEVKRLWHGPSTPPPSSAAISRSARLESQNSVRLGARAGGKAPGAAGGDLSEPLSVAENQAPCTVQRSAQFFCVAASFKGKQSNFPRKGLDGRSDRRNLSPRHRII